MLQIPSSIGYTLYTKTKKYRDTKTNEESLKGRASEIQTDRELAT